MDKNKPFIGAKDRQIQVSVRSTSQSAIGEPKENVTLLFTTWAQMIDASGGESVEGKITHEVNRKYRMRYREVLETHGNQLVITDAGQKFEVEHTMVIGRRDHIELICKRYE